MLYLSGALEMKRKHLKGEGEIKGNPKDKK